MKKVMTPMFRVAYPQVFAPRKNELNGKDEYSVLALFPKGADLTILKEAAKAAIKEKWGDKVPANLRTPFRDQGDRAKLVDGKRIIPAGHEEGAFFLNLKSSQRPGVVSETVQDIIDKDDFYSGCWARATVTVYCYDNLGNRGVSFGLSNLQKVKDDEPLGGRVKAQNEFAPVENAATTAADIFG